MAKTPNPSDLKPVDWPAIEPHYRAGIRSLRSLTAQFGVSPTGIVKHFDKLNVRRDLKPRIQAAAEELLLRAALPVTVSADPKTPTQVATENAIVDTNAAVLAHVVVSHRVEIARARRVVGILMAELEDMVERPELFAMVHDALDNPDEPAIEALRNMARLVESLPARVKVMKDLAEAVRILIGLEREAFGLDVAHASDGKMLVIIRDYTGRGDPDAPAKPQQESPA